MKQAKYPHLLALVAGFICLITFRTHAATNEVVDPAWLIQPGAAVGMITNGMTMDQVAAAIGQPDDKTGHVFNYQHLGFSVVPNKAGLVRVVMCGDAYGLERSLAEKFKGRTKEGIRIRSTRDEVLAAFGKPTQVDKSSNPGHDVLVYDPLGLLLTLDGDKVCHIQVHFRKVIENPVR